MPAEVTPLLLNCRFPRLLVAGYRSLFEVSVASVLAEPVTEVVLEFRCEGFQGGFVEHRLSRPLAPYERPDPIVIGVQLESAGVMPMTVHVHASTARGRCTGRGNVRPLEQPGLTILERPADLQSFKVEIREKAFFGAIMEGLDLGKVTSLNDLLRTPLEVPEEVVKLSWDGFPVAPTLKEGLRFGPFRLVRRLGGGGMGVVWLAQDTSLKDKLVALKFLPEEVCHDPAAIDDLRDEVLKARDLRHDHIVSIYHFHEQDGTAAISMEYIDGPTLDAYRRQLPNKVFEVADLHALLPSLCAALDYAHRPPKPLIHHDLKPLNLMLDSEGKLKVCDFGLAGSLCETKSKLSGRNHSTSGTTPYMSPQHLLLGSRVVTDDVYALGATLYELLTGKPPFYAGNIEAQIERVAPPSIAERRRSLGVSAAAPIPESWERAVAACLAKEPRDRPKSAGAVLVMCRGSREASRSAVASDSATPLLPHPAMPSGPFPVAGTKPPAPIPHQSSDKVHPSGKAVSSMPPGISATALQDASRHSDFPTTLQDVSRLRKSLPWLIAVGLILIAWVTWRHPFTLEVPVEDSAARAAAAELRQQNEDLKRQAKEEADKPKIAEERMRESLKPVPPPVSPLEEGAIGKTFPVTLPGGVEMKLCYCPAGSFKMGSPSNEAGRSENEEQVAVTLPKAFWLGQTEVTQNQWQALMKTTPAEQKAKGSSLGDVTGIGPNQPMYFVSWEDAREFLGKLNSSVKLPKGWAFALPTEAQWEYACRSGTSGPYAGDLDEMGWYSSNAGSTTHEVAKKKPNAWGLYDMHGNLLEWCFDKWDRSAQLPGGKDPVATSGPVHVFRGGSWDDIAYSCRSAHRDVYGHVYHSFSLGFRVAAVPAGSGATQ